MSARKRIALITNGYPDAGARERSFILPELKALVAYGHEVTLMPLRPLRQADPSLPARVHVDQGLARLHRPWQLPLTFARALGTRSFWAEARRCMGHGRPAHWLHFLKESLRAGAVLRMAGRLQQFDVIYTYWFKGEATGASLLRQAKLLRVTRAHGYDLYEERADNQGYIPYRRSTLPLMDLVVLLSEEGRAYLEARYPGGCPRMVVLPLGVESGICMNPAPPAGEIHLVSCSYPAAVKRLDLIAEVAAALARRLPQARVRWTHYGATREQALLPAAFTAPDNLAMVFAGETDNEAIRRQYAQTPASFFLNMSLSEGQPVSIMEAMAFGIPVVATAVGGVPEMLAHGGGLSVPPQPDAAEVAQRMARLLADGHAYAAMRQAACDTQRRFFNTSTNHRKLAELLASL